jgi:tRNA A-37 threonylcarbamoyl transferase component Bud32
MWGEGTVLAGRYQLRQRIGGGSMGDVWRALDTVLGREVAVKILLPALLDDAGFAARFHTEARVLAALSHPGIVSVFDYGEADDPRTAFLVMELITGRPLSDLLDESAPLSEATTLTVVAQTLEALQAAHDRGIVHRDVKPANLMLRSGSVVVTDFGVARTADARRLTAADVVLGTAVYAAPEQARHTAVTAAADQYAVGVIAYECLTGTPPFDGGTPLGIMMKHLQEPVPPLPETVSAPVRELVMRALAKDPEERFASAREMAETARRLAAGGGGVTRIGVPQDSFQTGVDVAGVEAAAAAAAGARVDGDFLSFVVVPREDESEDGADGDGGELTAAGGGAKAAAGSGVGSGLGGAAASDVEEIAPAWASYVVRPQAEGTDWASFTVRGREGETVPLPDGEAAVEAEAAGAAEPEAKARSKSGRVVPQDSFTAGVEIGAAAEAAEVGGAARAGVARWRSREPEEGSAEVSRPAKAGFGARWRKRNAAQESAAGATGQQESEAPGESAGTARQESQAARELAGAAGPVGQRARGAAGDDSETLRGSAGVASPAGEKAGDDSRAVRAPAGAGGTDLGGELAAGVADLSGGPSEQPASASQPSATAEPESAAESEPTATAGPELAAESEPTATTEFEPASESEPASEPESEPEAQPEPAAPRIAAGHAMPLDSFNAGVELDPEDDLPAGRVVPQDSFTVLGSDVPVSLERESAAAPPSQPGRRRAVVLAAVGAVVVVAIAVAYPLSSHGNSPASAAVGATQGSSSAASTSGVSTTSGAANGSGTSSALVPPPVSSGSAGVPHKSGNITNVGDGDAIDVFGNSSGAPVYADGATVTVEPRAGRTGQTFQATALTSNGQAVYEFGDGLDTNQLIDGSGGKVSLEHCACGSPAQMWWLSQDSGTPSGAFYIHNQGANLCLTDNGASNVLSLKPCVAGNKAQQWYLP